MWRALELGCSLVCIMSLHNGGLLCNPPLHIMTDYLYNMCMNTHNNMHTTCVFIHMYMHIHKNICTTRVIVDNMDTTCVLCSVCIHITICTQNVYSYIHITIWKKIEVLLGWAFSHLGTWRPLPSKVVAILWKMQDVLYRMGILRFLFFELRVKINRKLGSFWVKKWA